MRPNGLAREELHRLYNNNCTESWNTHNKMHFSLNTADNNKRAIGFF